MTWCAEYLLGGLSVGHVGHDGVSREWHLAYIGWVESLWGLRVRIHLCCEPPMVSYTVPKVEALETVQISGVRTWDSDVKFVIFLDGPQGDCKPIPKKKTFFEYSCNFL